MNQFDGLETIVVRTIRPSSTPSLQQFVQYPLRLPRPQLRKHSLVYRNTGWWGSSSPRLFSTDQGIYERENYESWGIYMHCRQHTCLRLVSEGPLQGQEY